MQINAAHKQSLPTYRPSDIIQALCQVRGITDINDFFKPDSPLEMTLAQFGYLEAFEQIMPFLEELFIKKKQVVVYTDYDADGITGGTVMWETLHTLGFRVMPYVPHRAKEGYGFSIHGIDSVKKEFDPALIISVDHGITAVEQIAYAKKCGISVIVTDHHHKQEQIPKDAIGIFHIPALSGSGVAYMFAKEVFRHFLSHQARLGISDEIIKRLHDMFSRDFAAIAAIGTVADLVPLVGPSRQLVSYGLSVFPSVKRPGITALIASAGITGKPISTFEIGYLIAPRINAVGRLEHAIDALRLLCTPKKERADELASRIGDLNTDRQALVKASVKEAKEMVEQMKSDTGTLPKLLIVSSRTWHEGIIGLIASQLVEEYYRPAIVMTETDELFKGSARSISSFHITQYFEQLKALFLNFGGHAQAAGFSLPKAHIDRLMTEGLSLAESLIHDDDLIRSYQVDLELPLSHATMRLAKELECLQPFGIGNPRPSFMSEVELVDAKILGKTGEHLKLMVQAVGKSSFPLELVAFKKAHLFAELVKGMKLTIAYQLDINTWNGKEKLQGKLLALNH